MCLLNDELLLAFHVKTSYYMYCIQHIALISNYKSKWASRARKPKLPSHGRHLGDQPPRRRSPINNNYLFIRNFLLSFLYYLLHCWPSTLYRLQMFMMTKASNFKNEWYRQDSFLWHNILYNSQDDPYMRNSAYILSNLVRICEEYH